jgi:hypothetical protein
MVAIKVRKRYQLKTKVNYPVVFSLILILHRAEIIKRAVIKGEKS